MPLDPLQSLVDQAAEGELEARLRQLLERQREVIEELRFGLGDCVAQTADSVAAQLGLARELIRQIELHALSRLAA
jgi:RNA polymerase nonessential primary-like sigma factor